MSASHERIPVTLLTGFLGSGKTTLVNALLRHPDLADTAVIVNEFGAIALDHLLITSADDNVVLLGAGCLCCAAQGSLRETLADLFVRRVNGEVPKFRRVLIESSGLADPGPIINQLAFDSLARAEFELAQVVTVVDATNARDQLEHYPEAMQQVALADLLLISKADLAAPQLVAALQEQLIALNPTASQVIAARGEVAIAAHGEGDPLRILHTATTSRHGPHWLATTSTANPQARGGEARQGGYLGVRTHANHTRGVRSIAARLDRPVSWSGLAAWMALTSDAFGRDLLRVKGIVAMAEPGTPVVVHAVAGQFHSPERLPHWPDDDHDSRIVVIARNIDPARLELSLKALALPQGASQPASLDELAALSTESIHAI